MDDISDEQAEIILDFLKESRDLLDQLEPEIIELGGKKDEQVLNEVFRLFHSLKGGAGFLEFNNISSIAHAAENLLDKVRSSNDEFTSSQVDLLCETIDFLKECMDYVQNNFNDKAMEEVASALTKKLKASINDGEPDQSTAEPEPEPEPEEKDSKEEPGPEVQNREPENDGFDMEISDDMLKAFVQEAEELLQNYEQGLLKWIDSPDDSEIVASLFRNIHTIKGNCGFYGFSDLEKLTHNIETVLDAAKSGAFPESKGPADVLLKFVDIIQESIERVSSGDGEQINGIDIYVDLLKELLPKGWGSASAEKKEGLLGNILINQKEITDNDVEAVIKEQRKSFGEILVDKGITTQDKVEKALEKQKIEQSKVPRRETKSPKKVYAKKQDIRVDLEKLDNLINLIGELVISENMVIQNPDLEGMVLENFNKASQQMSKIVRDLQEMAMVIRMIPVGGLFRRMIRLVHDLSGKSKKLVDFRLHGEETEVDKTVVETITDPLVHIIRNSLDHGLEHPGERVEAGKNEKGVLKLTAKHEEGEVWIIIEDDGRGLNKEKILKKAIEKNLIEGDGSNIPDKDIYQLIFNPGFSTAEKVTDISGRGVGMDVVKKNIEKIKGKINVTSEPGKGTKIVLRIPLTLAIIDGMMIKVGESKYILPILSIIESFRPVPEAITISPDGQEVVRVRENFLPVIRLHEMHDIEPKSKVLSDGILIVLETHEANIALFVDEILNQQQTVIKGLSGYIGNVKGVSGCTILGNGDVCLILDVQGIM